LQGILQGESMDKIAKRLRNVQEMNKTQAIRSARTIVTGAENKGRQDSYARAEADGIILEKEWIATNDARTRHWHADLDGEKVDQDKPFKNDFGKIMFPGDPSAHPANTYNCRCSMTAVVKGFKKTKNKQENQSQQKKGIPIVGVALFALLLSKFKSNGKTTSNLYSYTDEQILYMMSEKELEEIAIDIFNKKHKNGNLNDAKKLFGKSTKEELIEYILFMGA
jgi:SPP1 gp7 family putative phage head morphogenesis protein